MLGWEFPSLFTGGLGMATYGIEPHKQIET
jgi:hypothetical protein